jgi:TonB family protein
MKRSVISAIAAVVLVAGVVDARADDLATARDLYASAAYEEALTALNRVRASGIAPADTLAVEETRAFCLLALGRNAEAQTAIEALVAVDPLYRPAPDLSPRVRSAFSEVRQRLLPGIIPQQYAKAKAAFDKKDYGEAAALFAQVLNALADPDVVRAAGQPPLSDLRTLALGFQELAVKAIPPPPPLPVAPVVAPEIPAPGIAAAPAAPRIFTALDAKVVAPAAIRQDLPPFNGRISNATTGSLEVTINERGLVEAATMVESVSPAYDRQAVDATRAWRYRPAIFDGMPVKFKKVIQIAVKPTP